MPFNCDKMRQKRDRLGITRSALARELNVEGGTIYNWETGKRTPSIDHLDAIAKALGLRSRDLISEPEPTRKGK